MHAAVLQPPLWIELPAMMPGALAAALFAQSQPGGSDDDSAGRDAARDVDRGASA